MAGPVRLTYAQGMKLRRALRPGLVLTVSACTHPAPEAPKVEEPTRNPPAIQTVTATFPTAPFTPHQGLNPRDEAQRVIHMAESGNCYVDVPPKEPPKSVGAVPTQQVVCPPELLADPAWKDCAGGDLQIVDLGPPAHCQCFFAWNPPPAPRDNACPVVSIPGLKPA